MFLNAIKAVFYAETIKIGACSNSVQHGAAPYALFTRALFIPESAERIFYKQQVGQWNSTYFSSF